MLCNKCHLKLYCKCNEKRDINNRSTLVFDFKEHSDNECLVWKRKSGRPAKSVKLVESSETFDVQETAKNLDSVHLLTVVHLRLNILGCLKI